jgi:hypothetical protein
MRDKLILTEIYNLSSLEKGCIASNKHFEILLGFSTKSVSNAISDLVKRGILEIKLSDRNNTRIIKIIDNSTLDLLSTKSGGVSTKSGGVSTKSGESKENNTINNTVNKYKGFLQELKTLVAIKSKVTFTKEGEEIFRDIKDVEKLKRDYVTHQLKEKNFSKRITAFMQDYEFYIQDEKPQTQEDEFGGWK